MSILSSMFNGISGMQGQGEAVAIYGDNIANANTTGFKTSRPEFQDVVAGGRLPPLVDSPAINTVSTPSAVKVEASEVAKNALAYCFEITVSPATGSSPSANAASSGCAPSSKQARAGTLRKNTPPSRPPF